MKYLILFLLSGTAYANEDEPQPQVVYKQKTEIDFEGVEVDGSLVKPQGSLVLERKRAQFNSRFGLEQVLTTKWKKLFRKLNNVSFIF